MNLGGELLFGVQGLTRGLGGYGAMDAATAALTGGLTVDFAGSVLSLLLIELRTHGLHRKSNSTSKPRTTGLENGPFEGPLADDCCASKTGHWRGIFPTDRMTGSGGQCEYEVAPGN